MGFNKFVDCVDYVKKSTYLIARGNPTISGLQWHTLGTGVIVSGKKMLTCAHVINGGPGHVDKLPYCFIRHDELDHVHASIFNLELGKNLFIYKEYDLAIIEINEGFYQSGEEIYKDKNECLMINKESNNIGTDIGVMGYPLCILEIRENHGLNINVENIIVRVDKGVINGKYKTNGIIYNEFTVQFNSGNSGGPIFSPYDGTLIGLVHGYKNIPSNVAAVQGRALSIHTPYYSVGIPVENYFNLLKDHGII